MGLFDLLKLYFGFLHLHFRPFDSFVLWQMRWCHNGFQLGIYIAMWRGAAFLVCSWGHWWLVEVFGAEAAWCDSTLFLQHSSVAFLFHSDPLSQVQRAFHPTRSRLQREKESIVLCYINRWHRVLTVEWSLVWCCYTAFMLFERDLPDPLLVTVWPYWTRLSSLRVIGNMWNIQDFYNFYFFFFSLV